MKSANTAAFSFTVAAIFGDHMVLQRDKPVRVWGESQIPQTIRVSIDGSQVASTQAGAGPWQITLPPMQARRGLVLQIAGQDQAECRTFQDVAIGEVWIAGGQSNMEFALEFDAEAKKVIPGAANPDIRFYDCPKIKFEGQEREDDLSRYGFWRPLNPANAPFYSAVGYYFASRLHKRLQVPIGMVAATGAAPLPPPGWTRATSKRMKRCAPAGRNTKTACGTWISPPIPRRRKRAAPGRRIHCGGPSRATSQSTRPGRSSTRCLPPSSSIPPANLSPWARETRTAPAACTTRWCKKSPGTLPAA